MKKIILLFAITILLCGCGDQHEEEKSKMVSCSEMKNILKEDENAKLIDVRTPDEYSTYHLDNAINIEYQNIVKELEGTDKETTIIVYCQSGKRSDTAYNELQKAGYKNIYDLGSINNCK